MQEYRGDVKAVVWELSKFVKTDEGMKIREPFARAFFPQGGQESRRAGPPAQKLESAAH
jgi:hypothetical protein